MAGNSTFTVYKDSFLEYRLPDGDGLAARPHQGWEAVDEPVDHVAGDHRAPIDSEVMFTVDDHVRRFVLKDSA